MRSIDVSRFSSIIFDCDGVLLNSNDIKSQAFYETVLDWGENAAAEFVSYHRKNGGVSRYEKLAYFVDRLTLSELESAALVKFLVEKYASILTNKLMKCEVAEGLSEFKELSACSWCVVSGGDQRELRELFPSLGIDYLFDLGIYGSPDKKEDIVRRLLSSGKLGERVLFLGDSLYDCEVARSVGFEFVFVSDWTELDNWESLMKRRGVMCINRISDLITKSPS